MPWPVLDLSPPPTGSGWVYQSAPQVAPWSIYGASAYSTNTLRYNGDVIVPHLLTSTFGVSALRGNAMLRLDAQAGTAWQGISGLYNPRLTVGFQKQGLVARASVTVPLTTADALLGAPGMTADLSASYGTEAYRATYGVVYRANPSEWWQASAYGVAGVRYKGVGVEVRYERQLNAVAHGEAIASYKWRKGCYTVLPFASAGFTFSPGSPLYRAGFTLERSCTDKQSQPVYVVIKSPSALEQVIELRGPHRWLNAEPIFQAQPSEVYKTPKESIGGFLSANPNVIVLVRTNLPQAQYDRVIGVLIAKGLPMNQVERTEFMPYVADETYYVDFIVIKGNKEASHAPVDVVPR